MVELEVFVGKLIDRIDDEMDDMVAANPVAQVGRHPHWGVAI
jgi:hypothetical protein